MPLSQAHRGVAFAEPERDPRASEGVMDNLDAMRRHQLWKLADKIGINYKPGATAEDMRLLLRAVPHLVHNVNQAVQQVDDGSAEVAADKFLQAMKPGDRADNQDDLDLRQKTVPQLRAVLKKRGISTPNNIKKAEALRMLGVE